MNKKEQKRIDRKKRIDEIFFVRKRVFKSLLMVTVPFFVVSTLILAVILFLVNPRPKVTNDNVIREYIPSICYFYSLVTDEKGNYYIYTSKCIMRYDANWNYQYSYMYKSDKPAWTLSIENNTIHLEHALDNVYISDSGQLKKERKTEYSIPEKERSVAIINRDGKAFFLSDFLYPRIYDEYDHCVWSCSTFSFAAFYCSLINGFCSFFFAIHFMSYSLPPTEVRPFCYFYRDPK